MELLIPTDKDLNLDFTDLTAVGTLASKLLKQVSLRFPKRERELKTVQNIKNLR